VGQREKRDAVKVNGLEPRPGIEGDVEREMSRLMRQQGNSRAREEERCPPDAAIPLDARLRV
jgi:hypothetical protein